MKPGAIIATDNRLYMSYLGNNKEPGILTFSLDEAFNLTFLNKQTISVFITSHLVVLIIQSSARFIILWWRRRDPWSCRWNSDKVSINIFIAREALTYAGQIHTRTICAMRDGITCLLGIVIDFVSFYSIKNHELHLIMMFFIDHSLGSGPRISGSVLITDLLIYYMRYQTPSLYMPCVTLESMKFKEYQCWW